MPKCLPSFQRYIMSSILICFILLRFCLTRNYFSDLDLSTQTLNPSVTGFKISGNSASGQLGSSASTVGDIDNDGYDDIIVGAPGKSSSQGAAYVIYGGGESSFLDLDLSTTSLNPLTTGFMITGKAAGDIFGFSVSTAGDINHDGYDDILVGAPYENANQGAVYLIYGGPKSSMSNIALSSTTLSPASTGFKITGNTAGDYFGRAVSTAGDIDNDGYDDIIIAGHGKTTVYVIYGGEKSTRSNLALSSTTLNPLTTGFMITGNTVSDYFGWSVSTAGDINKDGYDDVIIGAFGKNGDQGAAYVVYGREKSTMSNIVLSSTPLNPLTTGFMITGNAGGDQFGRSVSTAGDINNDGYDDIIVGAYQKNNYQGAAYVIYGGDKSTMSNIALSSVTLNPTSTGFTIIGNAIGDWLGFSVSKAGDINNDGYDDIIVGAAGNGGKGAAYVIYGGDKSTMSNIDLSSTALNPTFTGFRIAGNAANYYFGWSVSTAGDINNDGYDDIIVGTYSEDRAYVIYASCSKNCKQCSSESVCTECKNPYLLYQSECFASCPGATLATSTTICEDCPSHCNQCSSTSVCTECQNSYILYQSQCLDSCPDTMFFSTTTCEDCPTNCNHCASTSLCTECITPFVLYKSVCLPSCPNAMFNSNNVCKDCPPYCSSCISQDACQVCYEGFTLSNSLCVFPSASNSSSRQGVQEKAYQVISSATQGIGSVVCVGSTIFPFSALVSKIVQNTRYLNLSVTNDLAEVYQTWRTDMISWNVPNVMSNLDHFETSPPLFARYDLGSPFLMNFWPTLLNISIGFGTFITCIFLQKIFEHEKYEGWAHSLVRKLVAGSFNFVLIQAYACLDDILFYLVLDAKTNPFNSFFSWTSMICAVIFLALGCLLVFFNFWTVNKYQSIKNQGAQGIEAFNERNKYWELFYSDFNDDDLWSQGFFAIVIIRSALSSLITTVLYDYPLMQTTYFLMMDIALISFLYLKDPFNTLRGKLAQYYYETITLLVHFCTFILSLQDTFKSSSETVRLIMSTAILYLNTALVSGAIGFMFIEIYKTISEKKRAARLKQPQIAPEETQNLTQTTSPSHPDIQKTQDSINQEENKSIEKFFFLPENSRKHNNSNFITMESNLNTESSRELDMYSSHRFNQQRSLRTRPMSLRYRQQKKSSIFPSYAINQRQFTNN